MVGAATTLVGAVRSLAPLGGWRAAFPPRVHAAARAVRRAPSMWWKRLRGRGAATITAPAAHGSGAAIAGTATVSASGVILPNPATDPERFVAALAAQFGELQRAVDSAQSELDKERAEREAAIRSARDAAAAGIADAVADTKRVELSGVRTQLFGVAVVFLGWMVDVITGG